MNTEQRRSWGDALATASPGERYLVVAVLLSHVRRDCRRLRCVEGASLTCVDVDGLGVTFLDGDGRARWLKRQHAWFVQVEGLGPARDPVH